MGFVKANRAGLSVAAVLAGWHAVWLALVAGGGAQRVVEFIFRMHGMKADVAIGGVDPLMAGLLLLSTAAVGYVSGFAAAAVWNCLERLQGPEVSAAGRTAAAAASTPRQAA